MNIKNFSQKFSGFTLVELITAVALIIILSVISIPLYKGNNERGKLAEGYALLSNIRTAQYAYQKEYGYFLYANSWVNNNAALGVDARGNKYFRNFIVNNNSANKNYYFEAYVKDNNNVSFIMQYNATKGSKIVQSVDAGWK